MEQLNDLAVFVTVAERKGFSAASRELGVTTAAVSKSIKRMEQRLNVRLFTRTTRKIFLTNEGELFYQKAKHIVAAATEAENEIIDQAKGVSGRIKILLPVVFGQDYVMPILAMFNKLHPSIELDIRMSDTRENLLETGADMAVRIGEQQDSSLRARKITDTRFVSCASPAYLEAHGNPVNLESLSQHTCIGYRLKTTGNIYPWTLEIDNETVEYTPDYTLFVDDGGANKIFGIKGCGIIHDLSFNLKQELEEGELVEVLAEFSAKGPPIYLVYPDGSYLPNRTRLLLDYLSENLQVMCSENNV